MTLRRLSECPSHRAATTFLYSCSLFPHGDAKPKSVTCLRSAFFEISHRVRIFQLRNRAPTHRTSFSRAIDWIHLCVNTIISGTFEFGYSRVWISSWHVLPTTEHHGKYKIRHVVVGRILRSRLKDTLMAITNVRDISRSFARLVVSFVLSTVVLT